MLRGFLWSDIYGNLKILKYEIERLFKQNLLGEKVYLAIFSHLKEIYFTKRFYSLSEHFCCNIEFFLPAFRLKILTVTTFWVLFSFSFFLFY